MSGDRKWSTAKVFAFSHLWQFQFHHEGEWYCCDGWCLHIGWIASHLSLWIPTGNSTKSHVSKMTKTQLKTKLSTKLVNAFSKHYVEHKQLLDEYLYNYDIKEFLQTFCGYNSFEGIHHELRKAIFSTYPKIALPDWNTTECEECWSWSFELRDRSLWYVLTFPLQSHNKLLNKTVVCIYCYMLIVSFCSSTEFTHL